jgi:hypothetical protein
VTDEETEGNGAHHVEDEDADVDKQMKECVDQAGEIEAQYAPNDAADILYDVQNAANDFLDGIYRAVDDTSHDIGDDPTTAPPLMFSQSTT